MNINIILPYICNDETIFESRYKVAGFFVSLKPLLRLALID